ncbi:peptide/nickel transport system ATP-binding protein [Nonomuraea polychroma]|uniref:Peptide/nickel transport system ATP-binding protein n=1 Tax=Nonomuraea polychroma TaxID=46176 RepID=A0A438M8J7_9ACTN|nr:ABC transporter ATP-binding protein [Nonomuraea polychroma]RVX41945.1 peptide/nickel transport system ATP-binding protein [Nonomuraea polychroma]
MNDNQDALLQVRDLRVEFPGRQGRVRAVRGVGFDVHPGESLAIVGESGSGKSVTARSVLRLVRDPGRITSGSIRYRGREVLDMSGAELARLRGGEIGMVFQDPLSSLNPVMTIGEQVAEAVRAHGHDRRRARSRAAELLELVGVPDPARRLADYPHQFSGGMRQRVMIAIALAGDPSLIIADEPTTALDVTVQAQILEVFARLNQELGTAIAVITHNLGLVARLCDRALVMYAGQIVEEAPVAVLHDAPRHPYAWSLLKSMPRLTGGANRLQAIPGRPPDLRRPPGGCAFAPRCAFAEDRCHTEAPPLTERDHGHRAACWVTADGLRLTVTDRSQAGGAPAASEPSPRPDEPGADVLVLRDVHKSYAVRGRGIGRRAKGEVRAVRGVSLRLGAGETLGLVGESGCGKSTLTRILLGLEKPDAGSVLVRDHDLTSTDRRGLAGLRRQVQLVLQDPYASLNPRHTVGRLVAEPLRVHGLAGPGQAERRVAELLELVGLDPAMTARLPRDFSGGQRQRIALARALAVSPSVLVLDEPVSALDVSLQAQIVNLLLDLKDRLGIAYLLVAHDIAVVRHMSDRIAVMYLGQIMEEGPAGEVCARPLHPYTAALLSAVPEPDPAVERRRSRVALSGEVPSPLSPPSGCPFHTRCAVRAAREICRTERPVAREVAPGRWSACHFSEETA